MVICSIPHHHWHPCHHRGIIVIVVLVFVIIIIVVDVVNVVVDVVNVAVVFVFGDSVFVLVASFCFLEFFLR